MSTNDSAAPLPERPHWRQYVARTILVASGLGLWFLTQALIGSRHDPTGDYDLVGALLTRGDALLVATEPINRFLHENRGWANGLLICSSAIIDLLGVFLLARSILGSTLRPFVGLLMLFALRQLSQGLCILPAPEQILWQSPGFPSLLVTYGVANDFFFSGHTGIAVYGAVEIGRMKGRAGMLLGTMIVAFEASTVLVLRAHYTMDVLTGALAALCVADLAGRIAPHVDRLVDRISTPTA